MTDAMQGLVSEAKKNKFSALATSLSDEDVVQVWEGVSSFIEKQMAAQKGVNIPGLGTFTFGQKKLDVGNNKCIQRPVFNLSEKFAQTHGLNAPKHHTEGQIPVVQLNFSALAYESPFDRDIVEGCVKEVTQALARSVAAKRNVEFTFSGIGRLSIRDSKVKMKFYKEFINSMDGSGRLLEALKDRPGTVDSVMSYRNTPCARPGTSTLILPRISNGGLSLAPSDAAMPTIREEAIAPPPMPSCDDVGAPQAAPAGNDLLPSEEEAARQSPLLGLSGPDDNPADEYDTGLKPAEPDMPDDVFDEDRLPNEPRPSTSLLRQLRADSRVAVPMAKASGVNFVEDLIPQGIMSPKGIMSPNGARGSPPIRRSLSRVHLPHSAGGRPGMADPTLDQFQPSPPPGSKGVFSPQPPSSRCGHKDAGQELCYLCHQRDRRNIPVSFTAERNLREQEEDRLLQQFQHLKDTEAIIQEQESGMVKRHENQKMAAFNLGVADAINAKKTARPTDFHPSYVFQKRPLTPPRFLKQEQYHYDLADQVRSKDEASKKRRADEEFLEHLEQVQLAEDLAAQREQYRKDRAEQQDQYKRALSAQVRFKPLPIPARVPDSQEPVFGKYDMTNEAMAERRQRAHNLYKEQLQTVEQRKRDTILRRLADQKDEEKMLVRTKHELLDDRANRFERMFLARKHLEEDWARSRDRKKAQENEEKERAKSPGALLHEQCDKYDRCGQCKRRVGNCGESNIWRESRYIPGSRLMV